MNYFDEQSVRRIVETVVRSERAIRNRPVRRGRRSAAWLYTPTRYVEFTLDEAMGETEADQAAATVDAFVGPDPDPEAAGIIVFDRQSRYGRAPATATGLAGYDAAEEQWFILDCQQHATRLLARAYGAISKDSTTFQVDNVEVIGEGLLPVASTDDDVTLDVERLVEMQFADDELLYLEWRPSDETWLAQPIGVNFTRFTQDQFHTNLQYAAGSTHAAQVKTRQGYVLDLEDESDWTSKITMESMTVVIDVDVSGTSLRKQQATVVYVPENGTPGSMTSYHSGTNCS